MYPDRSVCAKMLSIKILYTATTEDVQFKYVSDTLTFSTPYFLWATCSKYWRSIFRTIQLTSVNYWYDTNECLSGRFRLLKFIGSNQLFYQRRRVALLEVVGTTETLLIEQLQQEWNNRMTLHVYLSVFPQPASIQCNEVESTSVVYLPFALLSICFLFCSLFPFLSPKGSARRSFSPTKLSCNQDVKWRLGCRKSGNTEHRLAAVQSGEKWGDGTRARASESSTKTNLINVVSI